MGRDGGPRYFELTTGLGRGMEGEKRKGEGREGEVVLVATIFHLHP